MNYNKKDIILIQSITSIVLFIIMPFLVEKNWIMWRGEELLYLVAFVLLIFINILGNLIIRKFGYYHYVLLMIMIFLLYRNLPIYITNIYSLLEPNVDLSPLVPIAERKAVSKLIIPFLFATIVALVHSILILTIEQNNIKKEKIIAELALLKSQVNPHFFFNSLNSIYHLTLTKDEKASEAVITLSDMMRYVLTDAKADYVPISKEIEYINQYVELQKNRIPQETKVDYVVNVDDRELYIAPLMLISFIENAFKYGISSSKYTTIKINLTVNNGQLKLIVRNDVHNNTQNVYGTSSGIDNVKRRLNGIYPHNHKLYIYENGKEFLVELHINLKYCNGK